MVPREPTTIAYIAGLIDGEGCIGRSNGHWRVQVGMTDAAIIAWLAEMGGSYDLERLAPPRLPLHRWRLLRAADVFAFLEAVAPYLRVKAAPAAEALAELRADLLASPPPPAAGAELLLTVAPGPGGSIVVAGELEGDGGDLLVFPGA